MKWLNDIHSGLNRTAVREIVAAKNAKDLRRAVLLARARGLQISCAGGRHAMGGQQFGEDNLHVDCSGLNRVLSFDRERGIIEVEAGIQWPQIIEWLAKEQGSAPGAWGIRQKQTGADRLSIGGALSANIHGRGLGMAPIIGDVESFEIVTADGESRECRRTQDAALFRQAIGGYGLFGIISSVKLRLARRQPLRRVVKLTTTDILASEFQKRIDAGFLFGDLQFAIDPRSPDFLRKGVFACYEPVAGGSQETPQRRLGSNDWQRLLHLAHVAPTEAFEQYARFYLSTNGQGYWSDTLQLGNYTDDYHREIDRACGCQTRGSEMITELYVPRGALASFMSAARASLRRDRAQVIYGTIRIIERDAETFLPWARGDFACIVFNVHCDHHPEAVAKVAGAFRNLIDIALSFGGSFYLTYHRFAQKDQLLQAYPEFPKFLAAAREADPDAVFESNWSRHIRGLLG